MRYERRLQLDGIGRTRLQDSGVAIEGGWSDSHILEPRDTLLEINQLRVCKFLDVASRKRVCLLDHIDRTLVRERQGAQQNRIHKREHGDAHSDAERQTDDDHSCRSGVSPHANQDAPEVLGQSVNPAHSPRLTALLLDLGNAAQSDPCEPPGLTMWQSGANVPFRQAVQVKLQLCIEIVLHESAPEQRPRSIDQVL